MTDDKDKNGVPVIIDWRNNPDRVLDILGPQILLPANAKALTWVELRELQRGACQLSFTDYHEEWPDVYAEYAAANIKFIIEVARLNTRSDNYPPGFRLGMDRNNALPEHPIICMEPYLLYTGAGDYSYGEVTQFEGLDPKEYKKTCLFRNLFAGSRMFKSTQDFSKRPDVVPMTLVADMIELISWKAMNMLGGTYSAGHGLTVAYRRPEGGIATLTSDNGVSRDQIERNYGAWNTDGGLFL
jgi:hypothetical protein